MSYSNLYFSLVSAKVIHMISDRSVLWEPRGDCPQPSGMWRLGCRRLSHAGGMRARSTARYRSLTLLSAFQKTDPDKKRIRFRLFFDLFCYRNNDAGSYFLTIKIFLGLIDSNLPIGRNEFTEE